MRFVRMIMNAVIASAILIFSCICLTGCESDSNGGKGYKTPEEAAIAATKAFYSYNIEKMLKDIAPPDFLSRWASYVSLNENDIINEIEKRVATDESVIKAMKSAKLECTVKTCNQCDISTKQKIYNYKVGMDAAEDLMYVEIDYKMQLTDLGSRDGDTECYCFKYNGKWYAIDSRFTNLERFFK